MKHYMIFFLLISLPLLLSNSDGIDTSNYENISNESNSNITGILNINNSFFCYINVPNNTAASMKFSMLNASHNNSFNVKFFEDESEFFDDDLNMDITYNSTHDDDVIWNGYEWSSVPVLTIENVGDQNLTLFLILSGNATYNILFTFFPANDSYIYETNVTNDDFNLYPFYFSCGIVVFVILFIILLYLIIKYRNKKKIER